MSIRSYVRSTDCNGESRRQDIVSRVDVSVMDSPALRTVPLSDSKRQFINYVTAMSASLTRWKPSVNFYQFTTIPLSCQLFDRDAKNTNPDNSCHFYLLIFHLTQPGIIVAPLGHWRTLNQNSNTLNAATAATFTDMGHAATVGDTLVEVAAIG
jgi:hypothetical protein